MGWKYARERKKAGKERERQKETDFGKNESKMEIKGKFKIISGWGYIFKSSLTLYNFRYIPTKSPTKYRLAVLKLRLRFGVVGGSQNVESYCR